MPTIFHMQDVQILSFRRCSRIPYSHNFPHRHGSNLSHSLQLLQLIDIPYTEDKNSIFDAISSLTPEHVRLLRCETVTDQLLSDLATSGSSRMQTLELHYCNGFSSSGIRTSVHARQDVYRKDPENNVFKALEVYGTGPLLSVDDAAFFLAEESRKAFDGGSSINFDEDSSIPHVEWNVTGYDSIPNGYTTDLRPAHEVQPISLEKYLCDCPLAQISRSSIYTVDADAHARDACH